MKALLPPLCLLLGASALPRVDALAQLPVETALAGVSCNAASGGACDGALVLEIGGGTAPYTVTFDGGGDLGLPASETLASTEPKTYEDLCPGTFGVRVVDAAGATFAADDLTVAEPAALAIADVVIAPATAEAATDGYVDIAVEGGTAPYAFAWSAGPAPTEEDLRGVTVGSYSVAVTDAAGCTYQSGQYAIRQLRIAEAAIEGVTCAADATGEIAIAVTGTDGDLSYAWSNGASAATAGNLAAGEYEVRVTHVASGNAVTGAYVVAAESELVATARLTSAYNGQDVTCAGAADASAAVEVAGANGAVSVTWSTGATGAVVTDLGPGTYAATATDATGCESVATVSVADAPAITAEIRVDDVRCAGEDNGRLTATVFGGAGDYLYAWSDGSVQRGTARLAAGDYALTVTDANGCEQDFAAVVSEPGPLLVQADVKPATTVTGGSIQLAIAGGTTPYYVQWDGLPDTTAALDDVSFGFYEALVTDANGCEALELRLEVPNSDFTCFDASNVLTPGLADGRNDALLINCIDADPDNEVEVFNRWGQSVYAASGYDNEGVRFEGRDTSGDLLPEGGYFYVVSYHDDVTGRLRQRRGALNIIR